MVETATSTAIVTGGGGGIGGAIVRRLTDDFSTIVVADNDLSAAKSCVEQHATEHCRLVAYQCDIVDPESVSNMVASAVATGPIKLLINNAGGCATSSLHETNPASWELDVSLNLNGAFNCFHAAADHLKAATGAVINIASVNGLAVFGHPAYSAAKAGLIQFTRSIAVEYGKFGIRANAIAPGTVRTPAWEDRIAINPQVFDDVLRWYPLGRVARAEDIANAVGFLASDQAAAITGVCLPVDCGLTAGQTDLSAAFTQSSHFQKGPSN